MWLLYWWYSKWYICCGYHYLCDCNMCLAHFIAPCTTMYFSTHINRALWDVMSGISRLFNGMGQWTWNLCHIPALVTLPHIAEIFWSYITLLCGHSTVRITRRGSGPCRSNARSATMRLLSVFRWQLQLHSSIFIHWCYVIISLCRLHCLVKATTFLAENRW